MNLGSAGKNLIKRYEGCRLQAYKCPAGVWTIGYGHTGNVKQGQTITQAQADALFDKDVQGFVDGVKRCIKVSVNQNQFDALVSFAYNCGVGALQNSDLLKYINKGDFAKAAKEFDRWNKGGGKVLAGLVRRRVAEKELFLKSTPTTTQVKKVVDEVYIVKSGDTLSEIAVKHKTTVAILKKKNMIKDVNLIRVGQKIKL
jgi:GH24 family phage-related lysozyme (muramidase)